MSASPAPATTARPAWWRHAIVATAIVTVLTVLLAVLLGGAPALSAAQAGTGLASLTIVDDVVEARAGAAEQFTAATDGMSLDEGDDVRTDATGAARIDYADGSLARLDVGTELRVVELAGSGLAPQIRVRLDVGRVWNRVQQVTGSAGRYEVETSVGTAAVRGTAFTVHCPVRTVCTFTVMAGVVVVTTPDGTEIRIEAGESVTLGAPGTDLGALGLGGGPGGGDGGQGGTPSDAPSGGPTPDGSATPSPGDGSGSPTGPGTGPDSAGPTEVPDATELLRSDFDPADAAAVTAGSMPWEGDNLALDAATDRFVDEGGSCAVTVDGRNVDHANTPETAIEAPLDDALSVRAVATGDLESYRVVLGVAGASLTAATGEVAPDPNGDRRAFAGTVDVRPYAKWGTGLYAVDASTTGTVCTMKVYVRVTGGTPLLSVTGLIAGLVAIGGLTGLLATLGGLSSGTTLVTTDLAALSTTFTTTATTTTTTAEPTRTSDPIDPTRTIDPPELR